MTNKFNWADVRDVEELIGPELRKAVASGIQVRFFAEHCGLARQTVSGILTGRSKTVTVAVQGMLLETILRVEEGRIEVPEHQRRPPGPVTFNAYGDRCSYGHLRTPETVRIVGGKRVCKSCETRRRKRYELRKARGLVTPRAERLPSPDR